MNKSLGDWRTLKDRDLRETVGSNSKSIIRYRVPKGYESKERRAKVKAISCHVIGICHYKQRMRTLHYYESQRMAAITI